MIAAPGSGGRIGARHLFRVGCEVGSRVELVADIGPEFGVLCAPGFRVKVRFGKCGLGRGLRVGFRTGIRPEFGMFYAPRCKNKVGTRHGFEVGCEFRSRVGLVTDIWLEFGLFCAPGFRVKVLFG